MVDLRSLGTSEIKITPIGLGAWQFSEGKMGNSMFWKPIGPEMTNQIVATTIEHGINWADTAEAYGNGRSELGLAKGLHTAGIEDNKFVVATKWMPFFRFSRSIRRTIGTRLKKLEPYSIDLHQIHQPFSFASIKGMMLAMADLVDGGQIKTVGVSNFNSRQMQAAYDALDTRGYPLVANQIKYSMMDRTMETAGLLDLAKELGVTIIAYSPLEQGLLTAKFHDDPDLLGNVPFIRRRVMLRRMRKSGELIDTLRSIAEEVGATPAQVALNWTINFHGDTIVAIPGASKPHHAEQNAKAMEVSLSKEQMIALDDESGEFL